MNEMMKFTIDSTFQELFVNSKADTQYIKADPSISLLTSLGLYKGRPKCQFVDISRSI